MSGRMIVLVLILPSLGLASAVMTSELKSDPLVIAQDYPMGGFVIPNEGQPDLAREILKAASGEAYMAVVLNVRFGVSDKHQRPNFSSCLTTISELEFIIKQILFYLN